MAWCHDISGQNSSVREMIPCAHWSRCMLTQKTLEDGFSYAKKDVSHSCSLPLKKKTLKSGKVAKAMLVWIFHCRKGRSLLFWSPFWLTSGYETSERIAGLLLVIHSWPKVWCAYALVTFSLVLLKLIWLTHEALCIVHLLTKTKEVRAN